MGSDHIQGRRLGGQHPPAVQAAEAEGPEAVWVPDTDDPIVVGQHEGERTVEARQYLGQCLVERLAWVHVAPAGQLHGQHLGHQVAVRRHGAGKHPALGGQLLNVDKVAVMAERKLDMVDAPVDRLGVAPRARAGRRVASLPDSQIPGQGGQRPVVKGVGHQAHVLHHRQGLSITDRHPCRLLSPVLEGVEAQVGQVGHWLTRSEDAKDPARLLRRVVVGIGTGDVGGGRRLVHRFVVPTPRASGSRPV